MLLSCMIDIVRAKPVKHLSLHYDGFRIGKARVSLEHESGGDHAAGLLDLCRQCDVGVLVNSGFEITVDVKAHGELGARFDSMEWAVR